MVSTSHIVFRTDAIHGGMLVFQELLLAIDFARFQTKYRAFRANDKFFFSLFLAHTFRLLAATMKLFKQWFPDFVTSCFHLFATL